MRISHVIVVRSEVCFVHINSCFPFVSIEKKDKTHKWSNNDFKNYFKFIIIIIFLKLNFKKIKRDLSNLKKICKKIMFKYLKMNF